MIRLTISLPLKEELEAQCKELTLDNSKLPPTVVRSAALQGVSLAGFKLNKVSYDWGTARVVATVNPAHDKYPEMLNVRRQYRRKDETEWSFTRDGFSLPNPNRKMTQRIADGLSELAGMIK